ncbi:PREDICTED: uncharacterized protein LOC104747226 [Camelina sativa]|uniref:Uncharacterized protein LOC104747226 n=1 Tax=Camelina sativa TaxID=90675 RepID=A0ABM0W895_CAMSA|nr:PREDICTED: uncharacterized protein LOC104747226 [Camelina sativa]
MKLLIDTESDSSFSIDVDLVDTLLVIKQKIEKAQGIPVCKQTLFFQGDVLQEHFKIRICHILGNSRLFLYISPDDNPNQNNHDQTEQSPSHPIHGYVNNQDLPVVSNKDSMKGFLGIQDSPQGKNNQLFHQTEQSRLPSNSFGESSYGGDRALPPREQVCKKSQHDRPVQRIMARRIDNGSSRPSYSLDELLAPQDLPPVTFVGSKRNRNQEVVQTEQSSTSDSVKEVMNIQVPVKKMIKTSPMKLTVMVQLPYEETRKIRMEVNANDRIKELRKELAEMQNRGELDLPQGYFFLGLGSSETCQHQNRPEETNQCPTIL